MKASKELKIGLTVIVAVAFLIFGINYLKGVNIFNSNRTFSAKYKQIDGLVTASPVVFQGMKVGQVTEIEIKDGGKYILVTFVIDNNEIKIPDDSKATIFSSDMLGTRAINLEFGKSTTYVEPGGFLIGTNQKSLGARVDEEIAPIKQKAEELLGSIDTLVTIIKKVVGDNKSGLDASIQSVQRTVASLQNTAATLNEFVVEEKGKLSVSFTNIRNITTAIASNTDKINQIVDNLNNVSGQLSKADITKAITQLNQALASINVILADVNDGKGSLGKLIKTDSLHNALLATNRRVQNLIDNITQHPNRYLHFSVFGAKEKGLKLTADEEKQLKDLLKQP